MRIWILRYLLEKELSRAVKIMNQQENEIVKNAFRRMIENYSNTLMFLKASN